MTDEPEHEGFVYQILVEGVQVIVMADHEDAQTYVKEFYKNSNALILPVPVFKYKSGGDRD